MSSGFDYLVSCLKARYDHYSAQAVAKEALQSAGLAMDQDKYSDKEVQLFADHLARVGDGLDQVWKALNVSPSGQAQPEAAGGAEKKSSEEPGGAAAAAGGGGDQSDKSSVQDEGGGDEGGDAEAAGDAQAGGDDKKKDEGKKGGKGKKS